VDSGIYDNCTSLVDSFVQVFSIYAHFLFSHSIFFFFSVLGLELRAFTLSHCTSPDFVKDLLK
jgi:hypothetical protein